MNARALNWALAAVIALLLATSHLLDGPTEVDAAQAVQDDLHDAIKTIATDARMTGAAGQIEQENSVFFAKVRP